MAHHNQLLLPFASLDFAGRDTVTLGEIARKLGGSLDHFANLVEDGTIVACDLTRHIGGRRMVRVPVEEYRRFVLSRMTTTRRTEFLGELPTATRREIAEECLARMPRHELAELLRRHTAA
ncbi:MAG: hypothetical protein KAX37_07200 [Opitutaceae bacterium]|nr:hypothetical protein [Opitutaceae bacterium]